MADDDWEAAADAAGKIKNSATAFEDEEAEDVPDNWDDEDEEKEKKKEEEVSAKKALKAKLKKKEEDEQRAAIEAQAQAMDPRAHARRVEEEADFENTQDMLGGGGGGAAAAAAAGATFETRKPKSKDDFEDYARYISGHLKQYERSLLYTSFVRSLVRELCLNMKPDDVKEVQNIITVLHNEKLKSKRESAKGKKKNPTKPQAAVDYAVSVPRGAGLDDGDFGDDDFM